MKANIRIFSAVTLWLHLLQGTGAQRIRLHDAATDPVLADEIPQDIQNHFIPSEAMVENDPDASDTEKVAINRTDANPSISSPEQPVPISAILFDGSPGPKACRGNVVLSISLTKPGAQHATPTCYNVPGVPGVAQCGNFRANKDDGCEARVFSEPDCRTFANLAVFVPDAKPFGGYVRSLEITCGVVGVTPPPLDLPGLKMPPGAVQAVG
ncbi:hypothetical protein F5Y01DRAFT_272835 [Xylaria sp. FL0043]|nr:hypothetical protein F5Y01DRAFT_272835 [Xylaria sp. FL0043]